MKINKWQLTLALAAGSAALAISFNSCISIPKGVVAVEPFDQNRYLGKWYEIARLDFRFEKGLDQVTATYSMRDDGLIHVDNRGYDKNKNQWKESTGKARPVGDPNKGRLKVSFFGPFYAGYNVISIDPDYQYAMIAGNSLGYLWILSRQKTIPEAVKKDYLAKANALGFKTDQLVWDQHSQ